MALRSLAQHAVRFRSTVLPAASSVALPGCRHQARFCGGSSLDHEDSLATSGGALVTMLANKASSHFGLAELESLHHRFADQAVEGYLSPEEFADTTSVLPLPSEVRLMLGNLFAGEDGRIDFRQFADAMSLLLKGTELEKLKLIFDLFDSDSSGFIDREEFRSFISAVDPGTKVDVDDLFRQVDEDGSCKIDFGEFRKGLALHQLSSVAHLSEDYASTELVGAGVIHLLGDRVQLAPGSTTSLSAFAGRITFVESGGVSIVARSPTHEGPLVLGRIESERGAASYFNQLKLFWSDSPADCEYRLGGVDVVLDEGDTKLVSISTDDIKHLVLTGHAGAVALANELGACLYERLVGFEPVIRGALKRERGFADKSPHDVEAKARVAALEQFEVNRKHLLSEWALKYHTLGKPGKVGIVATKRVGSAADLSVAYSPGVAQPCLAIAEDEQASYSYTSKGHLVGVISNGTAVLGLGNIGAAASKPVMEGKAILFKHFGGLDSYDVEVAEYDPERLVEIVCALEPTFGGVNLEDIKAPECFYIEKECQRRMSIPVFHDDQHGTAIIAGAGLLNSLDVVDKRIEDIKVAVCGLGAAGFTCAKYFLSLGVSRENLFGIDLDGVVHPGREDLVADPEHYLHAVANATTEARSLAECVEGADVFFGLSAGGLLKPEMLLTMNRDPLIFALANPNPEIMPAVALETRSDVMIATGRSDFPNQVNNVCAFPFIFRGALDCRASEINDAMKHATTKAIADLARQDGGPGPKFGREKIIPSPFDPRLLTAIAPAVAEAAMDTGVARLNLDLDRYRDTLRDEAASKGGT